MNVSRKSIALYVALVFVSGAVLGVFGDRLYTVTTVASKNTKAKPSPEEFRRGYLGFMQKRLTLSETQVTQLGLILDETRARMNEVHERTIPEQQEDTQRGEHELGETKRSEEREEGPPGVGCIRIDRYSVGDGRRIVTVEDCAEGDAQLHGQHQAEKPKRDPASRVPEV